RSGSLSHPRALRPEGGGRARQPAHRPRAARRPVALSPLAPAGSTPVDAQRSDALFGQDTDTDSFYGYSGHIAWTDFKYLGERNLIGALHAQHPRSSGTTRSTG